MSVEEESSAQEEQGKDQLSAGNSKLALTLNEVIAKSMEKLGEKLADTFSQNDYSEDEVDESDEEELAEELVEPPHENPQASGTLNVLQKIS